MFELVTWQRLPHPPSLTTTCPSFVFSSYSVRNDVTTTAASSTISFQRVSVRPSPATNSPSICSAFSMWNERGGGKPRDSAIRIRTAEPPRPPFFASSHVAPIISFSAPMASVANIKEGRSRQRAIRMWILSSRAEGLRGHRSSPPRGCGGRGSSTELPNCCHDPELPNPANWQRAWQSSCA